MKKLYGMFFLVTLFCNATVEVSLSKKDRKITAQKNIQKKKIKKSQSIKKKQEATPYRLAQNISIIINFLIKNKDYITDLEPLLRQRREAALDVYRAEGYCILTMADACFPARKGEDILTLINWSNIHPLLGKDVYADGIKKLAELNARYSSNSYYKASQSEIARDKIREIVHENLFSIIDFINKISNYLPNEFYYSGHPYEGISPLDHVALYSVLSDTRKTSLSSLDACYHRWQVALYRNFFLLLKLIAEQLADAGSGLEKSINDDNKKILREIAKRELGDDVIALPQEC